MILTHTTEMPLSRFITRYLIALLFFNLAACSSMQTVSIESAMNYSPPPGVDFGSLVKVKTLDKREAKFRVTEITPEGLGGKPGFFSYEEMESLRVEGQQSQVEWSVVIGAILGIAALVFLVNNADSVRVCSGTPCTEPGSR